MIKHKTSSDLLAQQTDWQSKSCMFWALELGIIHVKQKELCRLVLFPRSDQSAFYQFLCTQCYQKCAAGDHLEMHECAKHWCFMANRIKLSMIPAFSLNLGFLLDHYDLRKHLHFDHNMIFMKSEKVHVMNVIQSWRPLQLEKTLARWP